MLREVKRDIHTDRQTDIQTTAPDIPVPPHIAILRHHPAHHPPHTLRLQHTVGVLLACEPRVVVVDIRYGHLYVQGTWEFITFIIISE